jgi:hypothetical protein
MIRHIDLLGCAAAGPDPAFSSVYHRTAPGRVTSTAAPSGQRGQGRAANMVGVRR